VTQLLQALILGLLLGGVYALASSGLTLVFGVMGIINVAHGAFLVLAAYLTWQLWDWTGVDPIALTLVTMPLMFAFGWAVYRLTIRRIHSDAPAMSVLVTFGLALALAGVTGLVWSNDFRSVTPGYFNSAYHIGSLYLPAARLYACGVAVVVLGLIWLLLTRTWLGRAIRASAQNRQGARLMGVDVGFVAAATFAIGAATAGAGGSLISVLYPFFPASQYLWISRVLGVVVLGGMGSLAGALTGALLMGVAESLVSTYISTQWTNAVPYMVIFVVLLVRPQGIFGRATRSDVAVAST
jgi:branched-chain amino acid transport system permease protein